MEIKETIDLSKHVPECHARVVWQYLFNAYRKIGGNLDNMSNLLVDYDNCKRWFDDPDLYFSEVFLCIDPYGITTWRFFSDDVDVNSFKWLMTGSDLAFHLKKADHLIEVCIFSDDDNFKHLKDLRNYPNEHR